MYQCENVRETGMKRREEDEEMKVCVKKKMMKRRRMASERIQKESLRCVSNRVNGL